MKHLMVFLCLNLVASLGFALTINDLNCVSGLKSDFTSEARGVLLMEKSEGTDHLAYINYVDAGEDAPDDAPQMLISQVEVVEGDLLRFTYYSAKLNKDGDIEFDKILSHAEAKITSDQGFLAVVRLPYSSLYRHVQCDVKTVLSH